MTDLLKSSTSTLNELIFLILVGIGLSFFGKQRASKIFLVSAGIFFLLTATSYLPSWLAKGLEERYSSVGGKQLERVCRDTIPIVVLGSGYSLDVRLPALSQLEQISIGRLTEGIRIKNRCPHGILVCSGYSSRQLETQASVARRAAIELGVSPSEIKTLDNPRNTMEEAMEYVAKFGPRTAVVVTDAVHMPRAVHFFNYAGVHVIPAPTNFLVRGNLSRRPGYWPALSNMQLMDRVLHEYFAEWFFYLTH